MKETKFVPEQCRRCRAEDCTDCPHFFEAVPEVPLPPVKFLGDEFEEEDGVRLSVAPHVGILKLEIDYADNRVGYVYLSPAQVAYLAGLFASLHNCPTCGRWQLGPGDCPWC